jgi:DnaJ like chaperone protein
MSKYDKWIGAGLGWLVGGPIGGLLGFAAGSLLNDAPKAEATHSNSSLSELEACLLVIASHVVTADGAPTLQQIEFVRNQLIAFSGEKNIDEKMRVFNHCLAHRYELEKSCGYIRVYQSEAVAIQSLRWAHAIAICDRELSENELKLLFYIAGLLNINDVAFKKLLSEWQSKHANLFKLFELNENAGKQELITAYRKLILKIHPDRNPQYSHKERKWAEMKLQQLREAYQQLLEEKFDNGK